MKHSMKNSMKQSRKEYNTTEDFDEQPIYSKRVSLNRFKYEATHSMAGPYKYNDFDSKMKEIIDEVVNIINKKYNKHYNPATATGIQDDGSYTHVYLCLPDNGKEEWYFMIDFEDGISCDDYYKRFYEY